MVCGSVLEGESGQFAIDPVNIESQERHLALDNPLMSRFLRYVERWVGLEPSGADAAAEIMEIRSMAFRLFWPGDLAVLIEFGPVACR
jgi:hypothetical protein